MLHNIPEELRRLNQWLIWKMEYNNNVLTKVPYNVLTARRASSTDPKTWATYQQAVDALNHVSDAAGVGFVLSPDDPYTCIDLDEDTPFTRDIITRFASYTERSPSGVGFHVWLRGKLPDTGRRRKPVEIYSSGRFLTMTGNVVYNAPIQERQELLMRLVARMGNTATVPASAIDLTAVSRPSDMTVAEAVAMLRTTSHWAAIDSLAHGRTEFVQGPDKTGSVIDQTLCNILQLYIKDANLIAQIWRSTPYSRSPERHHKMVRDDYVKLTVTKAFDRALPPPVLEWQTPAQFLPENRVEPQAAQPTQAVTDMYVPYTPPGQQVASDDADQSLDGQVADVTLYQPEPLPPLPGLVGQLASYIYGAAPRQIPSIAIAGAFGFMAGICGRAFSVSGAGLNIYLLSLADTGMGKSAAPTGINDIITAIAKTHPSIENFFVNGDFKSGAGLTQHISEHPSSLGMVGEVVQHLEQMSLPTAKENMLTQKRALLELYEASAVNYTYRPRKASQSANTGKIVKSPSFSMLGDGTPEKFYDTISTDMLSEGLLPRFIIFEYRGKRVVKNRYPIKVPSELFVQRMTTMFDTVLKLNNAVDLDPTKRHHIPFADDEAQRLFSLFDDYCDRAVSLPNVGELWSRAALSAHKLAALLAIGVHPSNPTIAAEHVNWAVSFIKEQTTYLANRFANNDVGASSARQLYELKRQAKYYFDSQKRNSAVMPDMYNRGFIQGSVLRAVCMRRAAFAKEGNRALAAYQAVLQVLQREGYLVDMSAQAGSFRGELYVLGPAAR